MDQPGWPWECSGTACLGLLQAIWAVLGGGTTGHGVDSEGSESTGSGAKPSGRRFPFPLCWHHDPGRSYISSLSLGFLICKTDTIITISISKGGYEGKMRWCVQCLV